MRWKESRTGCPAFLSKFIVIGGNNVIPFPDKKYSIIYADPPWSYSDSGCSGAAAAQYATMSINELKQLPVNPAGGV